MGGWTENDPGCRGSLIHFWLAHGLFVVQSTKSSKTRPRFSWAMRSFTWRVWLSRE
jgi:hypothetical protein